MFDAIAFAKRLIDIPSPTENEFDAAVFLHDELAALGYACRRMRSATRRFNVYAAAGGRPRVVLNSHIDTVPPWFASSEDDEYLYGRGACDTKGIIAAMIAAGERLRADGMNDFAFLFVVGEETDSIGAKMANIEFADLGSEYVLVGEPTESTFARASKGALTCFVRFDGIAGALRVSGARRLGDQQDGRGDRRDQRHRLGLATTTSARPRSTSASCAAARSRTSFPPRPSAR